MIWIASTPIAIGLILFVGSRRIAERLAPSTSVRLLTGLSLSIALCTGLVFSVAATLVCAQWAPLSSLGGWSGTTLRSRMGFPVAAGLAALVVVVVCLTSALGCAARSVRNLVAANRLASQLTPAGAGLVVLEEGPPTAYAVVGVRGRIVVSTSMLAVLSSDERRVLLAHEASHLRHAHQLYVHLARVSAAANPLLRPAADTIKRAVERWADEDAAASVGDRRLAARTLARAALASAGTQYAPHSLAIADNAIAERVRFLLAPPSKRSGALAALLVSAVVGSWIAAAVVAVQANDLVQVAEQVYGRR
jgi:Zn-dependent protease with chaperone function